MMKYGLLGKHLSHSFSQRFFESYFKEHKIDASYELIELSSPDALKDFMLGSVAQYQGLNVTIPFKEHLLEFIDEVSSEAQIIGAINTIKVGSNGKICGYNTDAYGFHQSIKPFLDFNHHRAIILGTGGASKAVAFVLEKLGLDVFFISRNPVGSKQFSYSEINAQMLSTCKLVINCTPVGMFPNSDNLIDIPYEFLTKKHLIIDLIYNPSETLFLKKSRESGATVLNGDSMLHQQALKSWELWNQ
jgi:shikimate dehydrogenase